MKNILFICRHNIFRSRIAEEYMKKISDYNISSAGIIKGNYVPKTQKKVALKFGLDISYKPKTLSINLLEEQDLVIVIAKDIPKKVFDNPIYNLDKKILFWGINDAKDLFNPSENDSEEIIERIIKKINTLNRKLK